MPESNDAAAAVSGLLLAIGALIVIAIVGGLLLLGAQLGS